MANEISPPDKSILEEATRHAAINWEWWERDYMHDSDHQHDSDFGSLPILQTFHRFRAFGADYSVDRALNSSECDEIRYWLIKSKPTSDLGTKQEAFDDFFKDFHEQCAKIEVDKNLLREKNGKKSLVVQKRVSLLSKLLGHWKPNEFAMWDQYARLGLKDILKRSSYTGFKQYTDFNKDFHCLKRNWNEHLFKLSKEHWDGHLSGKSEEIELFKPRILDNYLVVLGKQIKTQKDKIAADKKAAKQIAS